MTVERVRTAKAPPWRSGPLLSPPRPSRAPPVAGGFDDDVTGELAEVCGDDQQVVQADQAGHSFHDTRPHLRSLVPRVLPTIALNATGLPAATHAADQNETVIRSAVVKPVHHGHGAITEAVDLHPWRPGLLHQAVHEHVPQRHVAKLAVAHPGDRNFRRQPSTPHGHPPARSPDRCHRSAWHRAHQGQGETSCAGVT